MSGYPGGGSSVNEGGGPPLPGASNEATRRWAALLAAQVEEDGLVRLPHAPHSFPICCAKLRVPVRSFILSPAPNAENRPRVCVLVMVSGCRVVLSVNQLSAISAGT